MTTRKAQTSLVMRVGEHKTKDPQRTFAFADIAAMLAVLSPKRYLLLRDVRASPPASIAALARRLGRDYKRVHEDVELLTACGLLQRDDGEVRAPYDAITAEVRL